MMYKIEKNIPLPEKKQYPFKELEVGESFFVEGNTLGKMRNAASYHSRMLSPKFFVAAWMDNGTRVWRVR